MGFQNISEIFIVITNFAQVATRFIPAGAALLVEKPVAARLKPKFTSTHCYLCMRR